MTPESALIVPVPEAEPCVGEFRVQYDPAARAGIPAHITVLYPFLSPDRLDSDTTRKLGALFSGIGPIDFKLTRIARFPDVLYLVPDPDSPFIRLTASVATQWPETPPYGGEYDLVIPHLTIAHTEERADVEKIYQTVEPKLPISCLAQGVRLVVNRGDGWSVHQEFPFWGPRIH